MEKSVDILKKYWGFDGFRPLQEEIVDATIYGHDTFAILPTGGGKSVCFQVPGLALEGVTLVISPLIALIQDQVNNLEQKGIRASLITSAMSYREIDIALDNARFGSTKFLYTSPERLKSDLFIERFKRMNVGLIVVDEAHCISEWGHDFRPAYREIASIRELHPETPVIALTASATPQVQKDIIEFLHLKSPKRFEGSLKRENIHYRIIETENKLGAILDYCQEYSGQTGIVYCQTRRSVKKVVTQLRAHGISAGMYHGGMNSEDRSYMLDHWMKDQLKVMVATNAFGMGIDKPDVRYVLHFELPYNLEAYYQEAGRAGRDGQPSEAIGFWEPKDLEDMESKLKAKYPDKTQIKAVYNAVANYLKVAIGSGKDENYPFNIQDFSHTYKIGINETYYSLKILQLNELLAFSEGSFHPTRLKIVIGNTALYNFQVGHPKIAPLISMITRSYSGVFDRFVTIHEKEFAKRLSISPSTLTEQLKFLEQYGVIDISFQSQLPIVTFTEERLPDTHLSIRPETYETRKKVEFDKLEAMKNYIQTSECRSSFISAYFGNPDDPCGNCDNCTRSAFKNDDLRNKILDQLPASLNTLEQRINCPKEDLTKTLRNMMTEEQIVYQDKTYHIA